MSTTFTRIYPNAKILGINEMLVEGCPKWYGTLITDYDDIIAIAKRGCDNYGRKIRLMNLRIEDENGIIRYPDFTPFSLV